MEQFNEVAFTFNGTIASIYNILFQKIGYEKKCKDVVSIQCPQVGAPIGGTVLVKREADPNLYFNPYSFGLGPVHHVRQVSNQSLMRLHTDG